MICTVGIDILRDEGILYARRLQGYKVPVKWMNYEASFHGILHMPGSKQRKQLLDDVAAYLQETL
jgi:acetyl esterase/lipase